jgi:hypothetical protein
MFLVRQMPTMRTHGRASEGGELPEPFFLGEMEHLKKSYAKKP